MKSRFITVGLFLILITIISGLLSCKSPKDLNQLTDGKIYGELPDKELLVWYSRTPCFGNCPFFDFYIFNDLTVNFEGKKFVDSIGLYQATILPSQYFNLLEVAEEIHYFDMKAEYDNKQVMDLPAIFTKIKKDSLNKKIMNRYQGPEDLKKLYLELDLIIEGLELVKY